MVPGPPAALDPHRKEIVALARALLWDIGDLEEVLESILCQARSSPSLSKPDGDLRKWLLRATVLTVHALNRKRRPKRSAAAEPEADWSDELRLEESYRQLLLNPEQFVSRLGLPLRNALIQLSELDRAVFLLRSMCELKYQEIAEAIDIPVGTVMGCLVRARTKLRKALAEQIHEV